jgi:diguanylate cyclase (GGDEF)-like protein
MQATIALLSGFALFFTLEILLGNAFPSLHRLLVQAFSAVVAILFTIDVLSRIHRAIKRRAPSLVDEASFITAAENSLDDFYIFSGIPDESGQIVDFRFAYVNPSAERRLRARRENLLGRALSEVRPVAVTEGIITRYREVVRTGIPYAGEIFLDDDRISATWLHVHAVKLGDGLAITSRDITERKRASDHASFLAQHDQLTGLANRALLRTRLNSAIQRAQHEGNKVAVFLIDVDHFKQINDSLGHIMGDRMLHIIARRLLGTVRETDTVARIGGDEFVIVLPNFKDLADVERCGQKIVNAVNRPITIDGQRIDLSVSTGYCIYPDSGLEPDELLRNADSAMYTVKGAGRNGFRPYIGASEDQLPQESSIA